MDDISPAYAAALKNYLHAVEVALQQGNATEHAYRPALKALIEALTGRS